MSVVLSTAVDTMSSHVMTMLLNPLTLLCWLCQMLPALLTEHYNPGVAKSHARTKTFRQSGPSRTANADEGSRQVSETFGLLKSPTVSPYPLPGALHDTGHLSALHSNAEP